MNFLQISIFKILLLSAFLCLRPAAAAAQSPVLDDATIKICNDIIMNIYYRILEEKPKYEELSDFDEKALYQNPLGIYAIVYHSSREVDSRQRSPYALGITIDRIGDETFKSTPGSFNFGFPVLGLKITGYQQKHLLRTQYNMLPLIDEFGAVLARHQQEYMPLKLYLRTLKDTYHVREDIEFEVELKNVAKNNMIVKSLGVNSLFFLFNNQFWGTQPSSGDVGGRDVILKSGESLTMRFKGESFQRPREFEIVCTYAMSIQGVNPSGVLNIRVIEESPAQQVIPPAEFLPVSN